MTPARPYATRATAGRHTPTWAFNRQCSLADSLQAAVQEAACEAHRVAIMEATGGRGLARCTGDGLVWDARK